MHKHPRSARKISSTAVRSMESSESGQTREMLREIESFSSACTNRLQSAYKANIRFWHSLLLVSGVGPEGSGGQPVSRP